MTSRLLSILRRQEIKEPGKDDKGAGPGPAKLPHPRGPAPKLSEAEKRNQEENLAKRYASPPSQKKEKKPRKKEEEEDEDSEEDEDEDEDEEESDAQAIQVIQQLEERKQDLIEQLAGMGIPATYAAKTVESIDYTHPNAMALAFNWMEQHPAPDGSVEEDDLKRMEDSLIGMGFTREASRRALLKCNKDLQRAIVELLSIQSQALKAHIKKEEDKARGTFSKAQFEKMKHEYDLGAIEQQVKAQLAGVAPPAAAADGDAAASPAAAAPDGEAAPDAAAAVAEAPAEGVQPAADGANSEEDAAKAVDKKAEAAQLLAEQQEMQKMIAAAEQAMEEQKVADEAEARRQAEADAALLHKAKEQAVVGEADGPGAAAEDGHEGQHAQEAEYKSMPALSPRPRGQLHRRASDKMLDRVQESLDSGSGAPAAPANNGTSAPLTRKIVELQEMVLQYQQKYLALKKKHRRLLSEPAVQMAVENMGDEDEDA